jgi:SAM-dependent methyltransferase
MGGERTGERLIPQQYQSSLEDLVIYEMHLAAYRFALQFTRGKRVLDYGCGVGYGAAMIAESACDVQAVDVDDTAIDQARRHFARANLRFERAGPGQRLPSADGVFDVVLSFQVIEHVRAVDRYLSEARRVLAPEGVLMVVTPDRTNRLLPLQKPWNRWHVHEYDEHSLRTALERVFPQITLLNMTARPDLALLELRRCRRLKWLTLPATLPIIPDGLRRRVLGLLRARSISRRTRPAIERPFDADSAVSIGPGLRPSLNLVGLARTGRPPGGA